MLAGVSAGSFDKIIADEIITAIADETDNTENTDDKENTDNTENPVDEPEETENPDEPEKKEDETPKENHHLWKQFDSRWGSMGLGGAYNSMTSIGCLVTSICIAAVDCGAVSVDNFSPITFVNKMNSVGGFSSGGALLSYKQVSQLIPGFQVINNYGYKSSTKEGKAAEMKYWMNQGYYIICHTKYYMDQNGYWQSHFVYIEDIDGEYVKMNDPGSWSEDMFGTYWYKFAADYLVIKGPNSPDEYSEPPASHEAELALDLLYYPKKTVYRLGERLDLTGGVGIVTGINPDSGYYWILHAENMGNAHSFATYTSEFDSSAAGYYNIYFCARLYDIEAWQKIEVVVLDENGNYPPRETEENTGNTAIDEYYFIGEGDLDAYADPAETDEPVVSIPNGYIFKIFDIDEDYGKTVIDGNEVWVDTNILEKAENSETYEKGDINNDGVVDICDLSLLNDYLDALENAPEGLSLLSETEIEAADINSDGIIDRKDIIAYLDRICL